jgi:hypothetical protein
MALSDQSDFYVFTAPEAEMTESHRFRNTAIGSHFFPVGWLYGSGFYKLTSGRPLKAKVWASVSSIPYCHDTELV